jgi:hypothetical protein
VGLGAEYFDKGLFSLSSDLWYYRSGAQGTWLQRFEDLVPFIFTRRGTPIAANETIYLLQLSLGLHLK